MALDSRWVDALHARLYVRYGAKWSNLWAGIEQHIVKSDWAEQLDGISSESIQWGLEHLDPDFAPTAMHFRGLCLGCPRSEPLALPAPPVDPAVVKLILSGVRKAQAKRHPRQWAADLRKREHAYERLTAFQRFAWREALKAPIDESAVDIGQFNAIEATQLPPGMRVPA